MYKVHRCSPKIELHPEAATNGDKVIYFDGKKECRENFSDEYVTWFFEFEAAKGYLKNLWLGKIAEAEDEVSRLRESLDKIDDLRDSE